MGVLGCKSCAAGLSAECPQAELFILVLQECSSGCGMQQSLQRMPHQHEHPVPDSCICYCCTCGDQCSKAAQAEPSNCIKGQGRFRACPDCRPALALPGHLQALSPLTQVLYCLCNSSLFLFSFLFNSIPSCCIMAIFSIFTSQFL